MKIRNIFSALVLALSLLSFTACTQQTASEETTETTRKVTDKAYVCPMHCEGSASNQPGKCPVCDMDLEKNPDYVGEYTAPVSASADTTQAGTIADTAATK